MGLVKGELELILDISAVTFFFPIALLCKQLFANLTDRQFFLTFADYLDLLIFVMVVWVWEVIKVYEVTPIKEELFGPEEDNKFVIRFIDNLIYDITNDVFHFDYLIAVVTAMLWLRCIILLRLTESFGPMLVMIFRMVMIIGTFFFVYLLNLLVFSCIATLTLTDNPEFANLYEAMRTYLMGSLGDFDLHQYDDYEGWKGQFGFTLHLCVLFMNLILMINLLIAIMSDAYAALSEVRTGLYWGFVIKEMPKIAYDAHYGTLSMFPFIFTWVSLLAVPFLYCIKDRRALKLINNICFNIVYFPMALVLLLIFVTVNALLMPFAYMKTLIHKSLLLRRYKSCNHFQKLLIYILLGIPFLVLAQFTDAIRFLRHTYSNKQK